jgi:cytoskeletal protein CcmA (bactofilin family)
VKLFKDNKKDDSEKETVLGEGVKLKAATMTGTGYVCIKGEYCGDIVLDGELEIMKTGKVTGNIQATCVFISGSVEGNIICTDLLHIRDGGKITGDIDCVAVLMDEGSYFVGYSKMKDRDPIGLNELEFCDDGGAA